MPERSSGDGGSVIGACDGGGEGGEGACGGRGVGVSDAEIEDAIPDVEGLSEVFLYSRALRRASACASVRVPPPSLAKVRVLSPRTEAVTE